MQCGSEVLLNHPQVSEFHPVPLADMPPEESIFRDKACSQPGAQGPLTAAPTSACTFHIRRRSYLKLYRAFREEGRKAGKENKGNEGRGRDVPERKMETEQCKISVAILVIGRLGVEAA